MTAIERLKSLQDDDAGIAEVVAYGPAAIAPLTELLFERDPSGLFRIRCRAVTALIALGADKVLIDFLCTYGPALDPVEQVGDDAVINAIARSLGRKQDDRIFPLLISMAEMKIRPGIVAALAMFECLEAIPYLISALGEDESRAPAESGLLRLGPVVLPQLLSAISFESRGEESETGLRRLRSMLSLLKQLGVEPQMWGTLRRLTDLPDQKVSALSCEIGLEAAPKDEQPKIIDRLVQLLSSGDPVLAKEVENCLAAHRGEIGDWLGATLLDLSIDAHTKARVRKLLSR